MKLRCHREKVFGPGHAVPHDRNAKARIKAYAKAWSARHKEGRQHKGPITRAFMEVLEALLWGFHNSRDGRCFPSHEAIAAKAECCRDTVCEALKVLEWAGVLTWQHRITRALIRQRDLFGRWSNRWTVIRTSNAYVFHDPQARLAGVPAAQSENPTGTQTQDLLQPVQKLIRDLNSPLERALARFGTTIAGVAAGRPESGIEQGSSGRSWGSHPLSSFDRRATPGRKAGLPSSRFDLGC